ncbi:EpsA: transcriptional regulator EpsA [compost metagenome]
MLHVVNGGAVITPRLARRLLHRLNHQPREQQLTDGASPPRDATLTPRESQVLRHVASGCVSAEIGAKLGITGQTVNVHIKSIYKKLHVHSRAQAVNFAVHTGLI